MPCFETPSVMTGSVNVILHDLGCNSRDPVHIHDESARPDNQDAQFQLAGDSIANDV